MNKIYTALGTMSGTSLDGVDFSIIETDGTDHLHLVGNNYLEFSNTLKEKIRSIKSKITSTNECKKVIKSSEYKELSDEITMFHQEGMIQTAGCNGSLSIDVIGFHGITLWHKPADRYTHQMGDAKLLKKSIAKYKNLKNSEIIFNFRENDILNEGQGAPLAPIYHKALIKHLKIVDPRLIVNIGGITNVTYLNRDNIFATDVGPGNCLIDKWMKKNFDKDFDKDGKISLEGKVDQNIADNFLDKLKKSQKKNKNVSYDTSDFDLSEFNKLNPKDGAATLSFITAKAILNFAQDINLKKIIICGGGRFNQAILNNLKKDRFIISLIDHVKSLQSDNPVLNLDGNFIESQAFGYLAVRSCLKLSISFPETTGCLKACTGGEIIKF